MKLLIDSGGVALSPADEKVLLHRIQRLERRLGKFQEDLVHLEIAITPRPRRGRYEGEIRLVLMNTVLPANRASAPSVRTLLAKSFDALEREVARLKAGLRGEADWKRKRGARGRDGVRNAERRLHEARARLDQAMAGDRKAFDVLAEVELAGLRKIILESLSNNSHEVTNEELDEALSVVMSRAFRTLRDKPEDWSMHRWLARVARRQLRPRARL